MGRMNCCCYLIKVPYRLLLGLSRKITDFLFDSPLISCLFNTIISYLGPILIILFAILFIVDAVAFFYDTLPLFYYVYGNYVLVMFCALPKVFTTVWMVWNYLMSIFTDPGYFVQPENEKWEHNLEGDFTKKCRKCNQHKPKRAHHCSTCNKCVLKMDHHCPWILNCVGHKNHRYFLLFTLFLVMDLGWNVVINVWIEYDINLKNSKYKFSDLYYYSIGITISLFCILSIFNLWNWALAIYGKTTIEFWGSYYARDEEEKGKYSYAYKDKMRNLEVIFGPNPNLKILLPSRVKSSFDGIYWPSETD